MNARIEHLNSFLEQNPKDPFLHYALALEFHKLREFALAEEKYRYLLDTHPNYLPTYYHFAGLLAKMGQKENALLMYQEGISKAKEAGDHHSLSELQSAKLNLEIADDDDD
jgi:tetratricopeptide (TPR) repeat protein